MNRLNNIALAALISLCVGCGEDPAETIEDQPLQGTFDGEPWEYSVGLMGYSNSWEMYEVSLYAGDVDDCPTSSEITQDADHRVLRVWIPDEPGNYALGDEDHGGGRAVEAQFVDLSQSPPSRLISQNGELVVDDISSEKLVIGLEAAQGQDHQLSGWFEAHECD